MAKKKGKKSVPVVNKQGEKDIVIKIDRLTGRIPIGKTGGVFQDKKHRKKLERSKWKNKLKGYEN